MEKLKNSNKKNNLNRKVVIAVEVVILLILSVVLINQFTSSMGNLRSAQASVQNIYLDKEFKEIDPNITQAELDLANDLVNKVGGSNGVLLDSQLATAQNQFKAMQELIEVYDVSHPSELFESNEMGLKVSRDVDLDKINQSKEQFSENLNETVVDIEEHLLLLFDQAYEIGSKLDALKNMVEQLPSQPSTKKELLSAVEAIHKLENELKMLETSADLSESYQELEAYCNNLSQIIIDWNDPMQELNHEDLTFIGKSEILSQSFIDTPLNQLSKRVALTFDDGPNEEYTLQVLDILDYYDIVGTFFVMGAYVDEYPHVAREIVERGHIIGNHTYNHFDLADLNDQQVIEQIAWTQESIQAATGITPTLFRFPFGSGGPHILSLFEELESILWTIDTLDWESHNADLIHQTTMAQLTPQAIILMHDTHQATPDALKTLIPQLIELGYTFVTPLETGVNHPYYFEYSHL